MTDFNDLPENCRITNLRGETLALCTVDWEDVAGEIVQRDFGVRDGKGRMIGGRVLFRVETRTVKPDARRATEWLGRKVYAEPHATRDGSPFGALQRGHYFDTREEADAYAEKYFANAAKRAAKKHG